MKGIKGSLPNVLTFINMSMGILSIMLAVNDTSTSNLLIPASLLILTAALTDRFDGKVARLLQAQSELGKELDSLSDLISFGVAPIIIAWKISFSAFGIPGYLVSLLFPIAGAYRLARYNITTFDNVFRGLPITMAGAFLSILNIYNNFAVLNYRYTDIHTAIAVILVIGLSYLMVSKVRFKKI